MMHRRRGEASSCVLSVLSEIICSIGDRCRVVLCYLYVAVEWLRVVSPRKSRRIVASVRK